MALSTQESIARVLAAASAYRLGMPRTPVGGRAGEALGSGVGSSLEFQDFREYAPGDDPRHVDWSAYARLDTLMVRLYREEVRPMADIVVDVSRSMTTDDGRKGERTLELAALLLQLAFQANSDPVVWLGMERRRFQRLEQFPFGAAEFSGDVPLSEVIENTASRFRRRSLRYVVSDFLFEHDPDVMVRLLAEGASALALIQVLAPDEARPGLRGGRRLIDVETDEELKLLIGNPEVRAYQQRLGRLQYGLSRAARRARGAFIAATSDVPLPDWCREHLCPKGVLEAE